MSGHVGGENKKKSKLSLFFLVGPESSISEDPSTIEYRVSALTEHEHCPVHGYRDYIYVQYVGDVGVFLMIKEYMQTGKSLWDR